MRDLILALRFGLIALLTVFLLIVDCTIELLVMSVRRLVYPALETPAGIGIFWNSPMIS